MARNMAPTSKLGLVGNEAPALTLHSSPGRLAESSPHTLQEDLTILETVFASQSAIKDLQKLASKTHEHSSSTSSAGTSDTTPSFKPGAHGRNLSSATGVDIPNIEDFLPDGPATAKKKKQDALARRFSRRGVRLAVHSSIMDTDAHHVPNSLRKKWIHEAQLRHGINHLEAGGPSIAGLSRISEVNSSAAPDETPAEPARLRSTTTPDPLEDKETDQVGSDKSSFSRRSSTLRDRGSSLVHSPLGRKLGSVISRLSHTDISERRSSRTSSPGKENQDVQLNVNREDKPPADKKDQAETAKGTSAQEKPGWTYRLTKPFMKAELTTPDYDRGF